VPKWYGQEGTHLAFLTLDGPATHEEMLADPNTKDWKKALRKEYDQLKEFSVIKWVNDLPEEKKAVGGHVVYKDKLGSDGNHTKFKAQIITHRFSQIPGIDFNETFSSVAKFTTLQIFLSLAAFLNFDIHQLDIVGAYLQGELDEEIYMEVPKGIEDPDIKGQYWLLKQPLYGLKQSS
jgi:hypothetical protein